ncbi:DUF262 domain-containing protein [Synechocystis sp. B12]|nr:DUF262 domain-containing protein [Synechocystis sp. B12]
MCGYLSTLQKKQLKIDPEFQRKNVWKNSEKTRFIDSLIKQLPIPSMCISWDYKTNQRLVVDGLQRIFTIIQFLGQDEPELPEDYQNWQLSALDDIDERIKGKSISEIKQEYPSLYERVENLTLPITVIRFDSNQESHMNYLYTIFHRLNTGGTPLNNQEIRNCIYQGNFNRLLRVCADYSGWKKLPFSKKMNIQRLEDQEFILRFFAFFDNHQNYKGRLSKFLNEYMLKNKAILSEDYEQKRHLFEQTTSYLFDIFPEGKELDLSKVILEGLMIGIAHNIQSIDGLDEEIRQNILKKNYEKLKASDPYSSENLQEGLLQASKVKTRLNESVKIFSKLF